jgi:hypothetical protein
LQHCWQLNNFVFLTGGIFFCSFDLPPFVLSPFLPFLKFKQIFFIDETNLPAPENFFRQSTCIKTTYDDLCSVPKMVIKG